MVFTSTTLQPIVTAEKPQANIKDNGSSLLAALMLTIIAAQKSNKQLRKLKRKAALTVLRLKVKSFFYKPFSTTAVSDRTLLYILIGVLVLALLFVSPIAAIIVLLLGIFLILLLK